MHGFLAHELLYVWEVGQHQHPLDQALTILAVAFPEASWEELLNLSIGQRDTYLLAVRERTFGSQLVSFAECTVCQERLEFTLDVADISGASALSPTFLSSTVESGRKAPARGLPPASQSWTRRTPGKGRSATAQPSLSLHELVIGGYEVHFRIPNSLDLAQIVRGQDAVAACNLMIQQCVVRSTQDGVEVAAIELPERVITALEERMAQCDPQADVQLNLCCPSCGSHWSVMFDIVPFFWTEICAQAKLLLREVGTLASAYGWREDDILSMSTARRQFYLEMVT
ncbi:MAG: hypothetical protein NVSMB27_11490 [Ktedonobacteraceae bacterium]